MDTDMMDIDVDVDIDYNLDAPAPDVSVEPTLTGATTTEQLDDDIPAAYRESLDVDFPSPEIVNLQGVKEFDPKDPHEYAREHRDDVRVKAVRWINDNSVNFEFYSREDAALALAAFSDNEVDATALTAQTSRRAKPLSTKPHVILSVRQGNSSDRKERNAAKQSEYYQRNPLARKRDPRRGREQEREEPSIILDYGDGDTGATDQTRGSDVGSWDGPKIINGHVFSKGPSRGDRERDYNYRDSRSRGRDRDRGRDGDRGNRDVDSYRPDPDRNQESRYGRLRDRSASPDASEDGRLGFAEDGSALRDEYRSRSREAPRRRRTPDRSRKPREREHSLTRDVWKKDRSYSFNEKMGNHKRSDATDETAKMRSKGSLIDRVTKNGQPLRGSLMSRVTRVNDESSFGRLKGDDGEPQENYVATQPQKGSLFSRMTTKDGGVHIRGASEGGFTIRGTAPQAGGFSIRGAAGGD